MSVHSATLCSLSVVYQIHNNIRSTYSNVTYPCNRNSKFALLSPPSVITYFLTKNDTYTNIYRPYTYIEHNTNKFN